MREGCCYLDIERERELLFGNRWKLTLLGILTDEVVLYNLIETDCIFEVDRAVASIFFDAVVVWIHFGDNQIPMISDFQIWGYELPAFLHLEERLLHLNIAPELLYFT